MISRTGVTVGKLTQTAFQRSLFPRSFAPVLSRPLWAGTGILSPRRSCLRNNLVSTVVFGHE
jgi:hypothetical protein